MSPSIWALGGHAHGAPSHTMEALWGALGAGAEGLVLWVQITSDDVIVCAPTSFDAGSMTSEEVQEHDAGASFRARTLDASHRIVAEHAEAPWAERRGRPNAARYPSLEHALMHLSRRTDWLLRLHADTEHAFDRLLQGVDALVTRFGLRHRVVVSAPLRFLSRVPRCLRIAIEDEPATTIPELLEAAREAGSSDWICEATRAWSGPARDVRRWILPDKNHLSPTPEQVRQAHARTDIVALVAEAVDSLHASMHGRGTIVRDAFEGPEADPSRWSTGASRDNEDTTLTVENGLKFRIRGENYSGAAAVSQFSVYGDFDAQVRFEVSNPANGTTFELAAIHVDAGYHRPNLTFDVHGAPPYASAERDEDDGFRIGWNNGSALTRWRSGKPESSNLYNNYSRDVGVGPKSRPTGRLRLSRCGDVFNAYFQDEQNPAWVLAGSALVPALATSVFLRLGAKHWPKRGGPAPDNDIALHDFELLQWSIAT